MPNNEPKVRTRTRTRQGGRIVKTKTVTKGDGKLRVERTRTRNNALGYLTERSVKEKGPMGRRGMVEYEGTTPYGDKYGFRLEKEKIGGRKTKLEKYGDVYESSSKVKLKGKGYKSKVSKYTDEEGVTTVKKKGRGMKMDLMSKPYKSK
jgi:hypothetical protein